MKMKNVVLLGAVLLLLVLAYQPAQAGVNVGVGVSVGLPVVTLAAPPQLVVIPGSYAYFVPDVDADIVFYGGRWHRYWNGRWYLGRGYNGPWVVAGPTFVVPGPLRLVRPGWRNTIVIHERIHYDDFNRNWRTWERDRYWEHKHDWWKKARNEHREWEKEDAKRDREILKNQRRDEKRDRQDAKRDKEILKNQNQDEKRDRQDAKRDRQDARRDREMMKQNKQDGGKGGEQQLQGGGKKRKGGQDGGQQLQGGGQGGKNHRDDGQGGGKKPGGNKGDKDKN